ncbi:hypothetical protein [Paenisporosarcina sp. NPDC076898]|uniref:hypothetical protein n=1 Tax=unclassified Paenisporosarcina TaxID=2642018 RepID=UPI003D0104BE
MSRRWSGTKGHEIILNTVRNLHPSVSSRDACDEMMRINEQVFEEEGRLNGISDAIYRKFCSVRQDFNKGLSSI